MSFFTPVLLDRVDVRPAGPEELLEERTCALRVTVEDALSDERATAVRRERLCSAVVHLQRHALAVADRDRGLQLLHPRALSHRSLLDRRRQPGGPPG